MFAKGWSIYQFADDTQFISVATKILVIDLLLNLILLFLEFMIIHLGMGSLSMYPSQL